MEINHETVKQACKSRGVTLGEALRAAGVSTNAYYSLVRKASVLPRSISQLASVLDVPVSEFLFDAQAIAREHQEMMEEVETICAAIGPCDKEVVRQTVQLLRQSPEERLKRGLALGRIKLSQ